LELSDSTWVPDLLFVYLGCFFLQKAIRRGAKQSWSWGRGGGPVAVSRWGYASWAASFFAIAFIITQAPKPPPASVALLMACFLTTLGGVALTRIATTRLNALQSLLGIEMPNLEECASA
jgi:hypothetical protein